MARSASPLKSASKTKSTTRKGPDRSRTSATKRPVRVQKQSAARFRRRVVISEGGVISKSSAKLLRSYPAAMDYLAAQINHERRPPRKHQRGMFTLARMQRLLKDLDQPQDRFKCIHVAGTKGKGSTAVMLASMLANNGLKVGVYTSPHVMDIRERIVVNDAMISKHDMARYIARIAEVTAGYEKDRPTYFEILTAVAFLYFAEQGVDLAVVEVGLGGRFDATNTIKPEAIALTSISLDHMAQLGDTVEQIASEKAGVFKRGVPIISAPQPTGVKRVLKKAADETGSRLAFVGDEIRFSYRFESSREAGPQARICITTATSHFDHLLVPLVGEHQAINCSVALGVLDVLKGRGFAIDDEKVTVGLTKVKLQGRMEMLCDEPRVLADGAHNAASIEALMRAIGQNVPYDSMVVIFGCCGDKDVEGMLKLIQLGADKVIFTGINSPRSADPLELAARFAEITGRMAQVATDLAEAIEIAEKAITREDLICITGSFYLVSEAKSFFETHPHRAMSTLVQSA